jgi:PAS domain S-box-containing protein
MKSKSDILDIFKNKDSLISGILSSLPTSSDSHYAKNRENRYKKIIELTLTVFENKGKTIEIKKDQSPRKISRLIRSIWGELQNKEIELSNAIRIFKVCQRIILKSTLSLNIEEKTKLELEKCLMNQSDDAILELCKLYEKEFTQKINRNNKTIENLKIVKSDLQKQLNLTYQLIKASPVGLAGCDSKLNVQLWNPVAEKLTGYKLSDIIGNSILAVFTLPSQNLIQNHFLSASSRKRRLKLNIQTKYGGIFNAYVSIIKLESTIKQKIQYTINFIDLGSEEILKSQLEKIEQLGAIARLSDAIMHDVRNPINALALNIDVLTQLLPAGSIIDSNISTIIEKIDRQISTLSSNLNRYVGYSRITELKVDPLDIRDPLNELILETRHSLAGRQISLNYHRSRNKLMILGDWNQLNRVFRNLIDNAVDAIETKGVIDIYVKQRNNNIVVSIKDDGHGIEQENLPNVFKSYFTTKEKGNGLGLFIVREIIRAHNGRVYCTSSSGKGARFTVSIPAITDAK